MEERNVQIVVLNEKINTFEKISSKKTKEQEVKDVEINEKLNDLNTKVKNREKDKFKCTFCDFSSSSDKGHTCYTKTYRNK